MMAHDRARMLLDALDGYEVVLQVGDRRHDSGDYMLSVAIEPETKKLFLSQLTLETQHGAA